MRRVSAGAVVVLAALAATRVAAQPAEPGVTPPPALLGGLGAEEQTPAAMLRLFTDSDRVAVRSWLGDYRLALRSGVGLDVHWNHERVTIPGVAAPAGTAEAVDAITTASRPISGDAFEDFIKVRNEFQGGVTRGRAAVEYYHSVESDYRAQQLAARWGQGFQDDQWNLSLGTSFGWDAIDPLEDDDTATADDTKTTLHWNAVATGALSPTTLVRVGIEHNVVRGLQHNPYRNVYAGGSRVPERHPDRRDRRDAFVKLSQWFENRSSVRLSYRFYDDDWGIDSHELGSRLTQYVTRGVSAGWHYRWYSQDAAAFHRGEYASPDGVDGYRTADYRMGPLTSHLFGFGVDFDLDALAAEHPAWSRMTLRFAWERYFNSNQYTANILETGLDVRF